MTDNAFEKSPLTLLGLGAMGTALARAWLAAGHPLTVWNRGPGRAEPLAAEGATVAGTVAEAVAASGLVVVCLLDDSSVDETLTGIDLAGKDLVDLTTSTPAQARARAALARERGARFLDGGIMAVPPMIGAPGSGAYVFYSGSRALFDAHRAVLAVPAGTSYVGEDAGFAALHDVALLSAMYGMFAGVAHAFALIRKENIEPTAFAPLLADWLLAMTPSVHAAAAQLTEGDYTQGVVSNLAMQVAGSATLLRTAEEQGVSNELLTPYLALLERLLADGRGNESTTGAVDLLALRAT
ncbi:MULTISPECIES: NAD(P)-dependent oxidoreductase [unclassified Streptomyces]|uniref:NAD(P)-dependent oxidoreductase n=1 Tax=unclassified Streptomyces TaxID=2593676 RepID=UPI002255C92F|nr:MULTISPECIES: NAD(P)-binding domain-containing protein [unclassified Streptomyces]WSP57157.1 NAD(P)-binding domain-containing protein [Streptomyces sp. NBC_01241]MCX4788964.1 NAD(P)-binding domain-containing protein [Streptomyces sp. NBC_01221]MCX4795291.1 NAD(P)-binding domain-containing protein [Streptomyces sp. NBC_01242]WSJ36599.1 NAD(P)-binding domain-containing protein [Streptomyces sp. NBC_01321]WSP63017.1 NAD(P)-binding domain-containing protein [Streptomyces sp. NBC_01240]